MGAYHWKKQEASVYDPGPEPRELDLPSQGAFVVSGRGSPDGQEFARAVEALYAAAWGVRMAHKAGPVPEGWFDFTVWPLEGWWTLGGASLEKHAEDFRKNRWFHGSFDRDDLVWQLRIRQPAFVQEAWAAEVLDRVRAKKKLPALEGLNFVMLPAERVVQALHLGPYADEVATFNRMRNYCRKESLARKGEGHTEVYLSDATRTAPVNLRTLLRVPVRDDFSCV